MQTSVSYFLNNILMITCKMIPSRSHLSHSTLRNVSMGSLWYWLSIEFTPSSPINSTIFCPQLPHIICFCFGNYIYVRSLFHVHFHCLISYAYKYCTLCEGSLLLQLLCLPPPPPSFVFLTPTSRWLGLVINIIYLIHHFTLS